MREFVTGNEYELLTNAGTVHFQNVGAGTLVIVRSLVQPSAASPGWKYPPLFGERGTLDELFPTEVGSLWARSDESTTVLVREL